MSQRGRRPGFVMSDEHRVKIQNSNILNALVEHVEGKRNMSASQVNAGLGLLKKVLPDLAPLVITDGKEDFDIIEQLEADKPVLKPDEPTPATPIL